MTQVSKKFLAKDIEGRIYEIFLRAVAEVKTQNEVEKFLNNLLSAAEKVMLAKRLSIAFLLFKNYDQRSICKTLKVSLGTVNRVNNELKLEGEGYRQVISKIVQMEKLGEFLQKIDDAIASAMPPKGQNWSEWRSKKWKEKMSRQKAF